MKYYFERFKRNVFFQNIAIIASGSILSRLIGLITAPIITRIYTPEDYGVLSIFTALVGITGSLATLRYAIAIPIAKTEKIAENLLRLSFLITIGLSIILTFIIVLLGEYLTNLFSVQHIKPYLWILPISFLGAGIFQTLSFWATRQKYFKLITRTNIIQSIISRGIKIGLGLISIKPQGLLYGLMATQYAGTASLLSKLFREKPDLFKHFVWNDIKHAANRYKRFPIFQSWSQLFLSLGAHLPVLLIASIYGSEIVGLYGLAYAMISMPMSLIGNSVSQVYYAEIAKYGKDDLNRTYKLSISIIRKMTLIAIVPTIILIIGGPWLFSIFFGQNWFDAGTYARLLSFIILFRFVSSPIMHCLNVLEKQGFQLFFNILRTCLIVFIFYLAKTLIWTPPVAILTYSLVISLYYLIIVLAVIRMLKMERAK